MPRWDTRLVAYGDGVVFVSCGNRQSNSVFTFDREVVDH